MPKTNTRSKHTQRLNTLSPKADTEAAFVDRLSASGDLLLMLTGPNRVTAPLWLAFFEGLAIVASTPERRRLYFGHALYERAFYQGPGAATAQALTDYARILEGLGLPEAADMRTLAKRIRRGSVPTFTPPPADRRPRFTDDPEWTSWRLPSLVAAAQVGTLPEVQEGTLSGVLLEE